MKLRAARWADWNHVSHEPPWRVVPQPKKLRVRWDWDLHRWVRYPGRLVELEPWERIEGGRIVGNPPAPEDIDGLINYGPLMEWVLPALVALVVIAMAVIVLLAMGRK